MIVCIFVITIFYRTNFLNYGVITMKALPPIVIERIHGYQVVRDDLFPGGTKRRAFKRIMHTIPDNELVYACDYYGHAAYAIALTSLEANKVVRLFYPAPLRETDIFLKTTGLPNVTFTIVEKATTQIEASRTAMAYAKKQGACFLPIGLDFLQFGHELEQVVRSANIEAPEIWCMGGSGTLGRALQQAYPDTPVHIVSVGTKNFRGGKAPVYSAPEDLHDAAEILPPYPSALQYDAKTWRFVMKHAKPNACIWNVAS